MRRRSLLSSLSGAWALANAYLPQNATGASTASSKHDNPALYDAFAQDYDILDDGAAASLFGFPALRQQMLGFARGRVLECGGGTGAPPLLPQAFVPSNHGTVIGGRLF